jgi:predicted DNA-binding protein (MmcQ/YjbR family)
VRAEYDFACRLGGTPGPGPSRPALPGQGLRYHRHRRRVGGRFLPTNMDRIEQMVARLSDAVRVDVEAWAGEPTFRVGRKSFVFTNPEASVLTVKLPKEEAVALIATDSRATPTGYGLGRHGWVSVEIDRRAGRDRWREVEEWVRTSYTMIAPKRLTRRVLAEDPS